MDHRLDGDLVPTENGARKVKRRATSRRGFVRVKSRRDSHVMPEVVDGIGERDINVAELHEALATLLLRYRERIHSPASEVLT